MGASTAYHIMTEDRTIPVIECPETPLVLSVRESGDDALLRDVTAWDEKDGDLTGEVLLQGISRSSGGENITVTYVVCDSDHHVITKSRDLRYTDYTPPRFALSKELRYSMGGSIQIKDRMTAADVVDGDLSDRIKVNSNELSPYYEGTYPVTFQVTNSLGDTSELTMDVVVRNYAAGEPRISLSQYLIYRKAEDAFSPLDYLESVTGGEDEDVSVQMPEGGLARGVSRVVYSCVGQNGTVGSTTLYVVTE